MSWPQALLFDLDGTLIDSAPDLATSINLVLADDGLGPLSIDAVRGMIGNGIRKLVERAFSACGTVLKEAQLGEREAAMAAAYARNLTVETCLYPGAREAINRARQQGVRLGIVTNKPLAATRAILVHFDLAEAFDAVIGGDGDIPRKPAPEPIWAALEQLGVTRDDAVMIGDSVADVASARAAGVRVVAIGGGYSLTPTHELGADRAISSLTELEALLSTWR